jgi:hypothetical protein
MIFFLAMSHRVLLACKFRTQTFALESTAKQPARFFQILGRVDAKRHTSNDHDIDAHAGVDRAQLLQILTPFIGRRREFDEAFQGCATVRVEPDVMIVWSDAGRICAAESFGPKARRLNL